MNGSSRGLEQSQCPNVMGGGGGSSVKGFGESESPTRSGAKKLLHLQHQIADGNLPAYPCFRGFERQGSLRTFHEPLGACKSRIEGSPLKKIFT